jgi:GntR family transcriptional regulator, vanillate catabolism transcriptional regulator
MNQQARTVLALRELILRGDIAPGDRITEIPISERLGVSRTPVRYALTVLQGEGLLTLSPTGGYIVRGFSEKEIDDAVDVRGVLEGMAARLLAEQGLTRAVAGELRACLDRGDTIFMRPEIDDEAVEIYADINARFHRVIREASGNAALIRALEANDALPFSSAQAVVVIAPHLQRQPMAFRHMQHHAIFEAIQNGQGTRAEALMREHANAGKGLFQELKKLPEGAKGRITAAHLLKT